MEGTQLLAGLTGFNKNKGLDILHKWCHFCSMKECVFGEHWLKEPLPIMSNGKQFSVLVHRHDRSILSILRIRYKLPTVLKHGIFMNLEVSIMQKKTKVFFITTMVVMSLFSCKNRQFSHHISC